MHPEAYDAVARMITASGINPHGQWTGLDIGGRDVNGTARAHLPGARWHGLDAVPGPGVDIVADARTWEPDALYDVVLSTELLEHVDRWAEVIPTMYWALDPAGPGLVLITAASTGRAPHGASGEWEPPPGEHYGNVDPGELRAHLGAWFETVHVEYNPHPGDVYAWATAPRSVT